VPTRDPPRSVPHLLVTRIDPSCVYPYLSVLTRAYLDPDPCLHRCTPSLPALPVHGGTAWLRDMAEAQRGGVTAGWRQRCIVGGAAWRHCIVATMLLDGGDTVLWVTLYDSAALLVALHGGAVGWRRRYMGDGAAGWRQCCMVATAPLGGGIAGL
jgi:hypothetical protein